MPDPEPLPPLRARGIEIPVLVDITEHVKRVIVSEEDRTGRARSTAGEPHVHPLPPKPTKGEKMADNHGHGGGETASKVGLWIGLIAIGALVILLIINGINNVSTGQPIFSNIFGGGSAGSYGGGGTTASGGGFRGVEPTPRYGGSQRRRTEFNNGQSYCDKYAPGTTFEYWIGRGTSRKAHCH